LTELVRTVAWWDGTTMEAIEALRWQPVTLLFVIASLWWVKWPLIAVVGACGDASCRRKLPAAALAALSAAGVAGIAVTILKGLFDRPRPPLADPGLDPVGAIPGSSSFPSGHSATAFAAAVAVGLLYPRLRRPLLGLAAVVALSRVYLGVHYATDVLAGSLLGATIGFAIGWAARWVLAGPTALAPSPDPTGRSSTPRRRSRAWAPMRPRARPGAPT
jgi:membrane-associated phospholipid phosphatase